MLRALLVTACAAALTVPAAAATRVVRVACDGRAVGAIPAVGARDLIAFEVVGCPVGETWAVQLSFRREPDDYVAGMPQPCPSSSAAPALDVPYACPLAASASAHRVTLDPPADAHFVTYTLLAQGADGSPTARKLGWVVRGRGRKLVTYALRARPDDAQPFHLERLGDYPVITDEDLLYAVIVDAKKDQLHFDLSFDAAKGEIANPAPIRPSFSADVAARGAPPPPDHETETPYADVLLPFGERFRGGDVVKVTISAEMKVLTKDSQTTKATKTDTTDVCEKVKERQTVKLIDAVPYPQVHTRYAYNFSTGLVTSWLRRPSYAKVQTDPAATGADIRYRTTTDRGGMSIKPVGALSFYLRRVDIQVPLTWKERVLPAPTLGFSLTDPTQDVFLGLSHELVRNTQLFYGWHLGKIDVPGPEDDRSSSVATVKRFRSNFFVGITLNIGGIKDLISK